ncbi:MAG: deoxycytidylate deaminase [Candidatus Sulfotelmatobacter sp.]|jgi:dCMP deaminase
MSRSNGVNGNQSHTANGGLAERSRLSRINGKATAFQEPSAATRSRENRHKYFMGIAMAVRLRANCTGNRVGAVIALDNRIISTGYNGTPENMPNCMDGGCYRCANRDQTYKSGEAYDLCICVHAEQNAVLAAARFGIAIQGSTVYTTMRPCFGCAKEMLQVQVYAVYYLHEWTPHVKGEDLKTTHQRAEYEKLLLRFPGGVHVLRMPDPQQKWAVSSKRSTPISTDEHGTQDIQ